MYQGTGFSSNPPNGLGGPGFGGPAGLNRGTTINPPG
jgi:hypothetical protein